MLTRTKMAAAALLLGSVSGASAEYHGVDTFRIPWTTPSSIHNVQLDGRNATVFTPEERAMFERALRGE